MKIVYTYSQQYSSNEEEADFDRPETIEAIYSALISLGHQVDRLEVSGPASRVVARLEAISPDMIFNTALGKNSKTRDAFYPGLFQHLGIPYTGSDSYVCTVTSDKRLTKMLTALSGIPTPGWTFVHHVDQIESLSLTFPLIIKPNFEGSSKGIFLDSVIETPDDLKTRLPQLLMRYPSGVLIEEFISGKDIVIPFLEKISPRTGGILPACEYVFDPAVVADRKFIFYDYSLQHNFRDAVSVMVPASLDLNQQRQVIQLSRTACSVLDIRDVARLDYRLSTDGSLYFIEANPLPSLEPGAAIYAAASLVGLNSIESVLDVIIRSAAERFGVPVRIHDRRRKRAIKVGLTYNLKRTVAKHADDDDSDAEFDSPSTIDAIADAIASHGHDVVKIEAGPELPSVISSMPLDLVFNIAEGIHGRTRESQIPSILELLSIPYVGSDPATLSICLDKVLAKKMVREVGIHTAGFMVMRTGNERISKDLKFPVILKPVAEGSSKGVMGINVVEDETRLRELARNMISKYHQPVLVEEYLDGREFTVGLLGEVRPRVLPPMEVIFNNTDDRFHVYSFEHKLATSNAVRYEAPAKVDYHLMKSLEQVARNAFCALGCRDVARIDLRMDAKNHIHFIECNPLPGLTPGWSDLCIISEAVGMDYRTLIGEIMAPSIRRMKSKDRRAQQRTNPGRGV
jgi:D-alanine-D-alanine ligase